MELALNPDVMRSLISTPSRLVGLLDTPNLHLQIVFPTNNMAWQTNISEGPYSRNYYLLSISVPDETSEFDKFAIPVTILSDGKPRYHYDEVPKMLTDLASLWFGKRFDFHGTIIQNSIARMPDLSSTSPSSHSKFAPYNHRPRSDLGIELNLQSLKPVLNLLYKRQPEKEISVFWAATRFYARALRVFDTDPEVAFFHFVVALEIISSQIEVPYDKLYDKQARQDLEEIEEKLDSKVANRVRNRYYQLRRKVVYAAEELVNDTFFAGSQAQDFVKLDSDKLAPCVKAAYDLRSNYAHGGAQFRIWFDLNPDPTAELQVGQPLLPDTQKDYEKTLADIPTFTGLERLIRFIILRFAHQRITQLHDKLE